MTELKKQYKVVSVVGARPQFIKAAVVHRALDKFSDIENFIIHTGQHYDDKMSDIFFSELEIKKAKYNLEVGSGSHSLQTAKMLEKLEEVFVKEKPDLCIAYGDTNSTIAVALVASKMLIPIVHVEAGLRSFNRNMPEEVNRIVTDHLSEILFAPTEVAIKLLEKEGLKSKSILTGDVMYDSVLHYMKKVENDSAQSKKFNLLTLHRAENTDKYEKLNSIIDTLNNCGEKFVFPVHPRTKKMLNEFGIKLNENIEAIEPVGYFEMMQLLNDCEKVVTDSGGLQKEAYFFKKRCITLREETEWTETLDSGWNYLAGSDKEKIITALSAKDPGNYIYHYGNGKSGEIICNHIYKYLIETKQAEK